jgi:hypothetical protein
MVMLDDWNVQPQRLGPHRGMRGVCQIGQTGVMTATTVIIIVLIIILLLILL